MFDFIFRLRAALAYHRLAGLPLGMAWEISGALTEERLEGDSPEDAVREDLTYWVD